MSSKFWYYVDQEGAQQGPLNFAQMQSAYLKGTLFDESYVWNGRDVAVWTPLCRLNRVYLQLLEFLHECDPYTFKKRYAAYDPRADLMERMRSEQSSRPKVAYYRVDGSGAPATTRDTRSKTVAVPSTAASRPRGTGPKPADFVSLKPGHSISKVISGDDTGAAPRGAAHVKVDSSGESHRQPMAGGSREQKHEPAIGKKKGGRSAMGGLMRWRKRKDKPKDDSAVAGKSSAVAGTGKGKLKPAIGVRQRSQTQAVSAAVDGRRAMEAPTRALPPAKGRAAPAAAHGAAHHFGVPPPPAPAAVGPHLTSASSSEMAAALSSATVPTSEEACEKLKQRKMEELTLEYSELLQELESERLRIQAMIESRFSAFDCKLDEALSKKCLRYEKFSGKLKLLQTQKKLARFESFDDDSEDELGYAADDGDDSAKREAERKRQEKARKIESKIQETENRIQELSLERDWQKLAKSIDYLRSAIVDA